MSCRSFDAAGGDRLVTWAVLDARDGEAPFWQQAMHALSYRHLYLQEPECCDEAWAGGRGDTVTRPADERPL